MKLKKIAALALAGVMAVSMLAACKAGDNSDDSSSSSSTPAGGISAKIDSMLHDSDLIELADNATYNSWLSAAIDKADLKYSSINSETTGWKNAGKVQQYIADQFEESVPDSQWVTAFNTLKLDEDGVYAGLYYMSGKMTETVAVSKLVDVLDADVVNETNLKNNYYQTGANLNAAKYDTSANYMITGKYTGSISMQQVSDGAASGWYALVVVNSDMTVTKAN